MRPRPPRPLSLDRQRKGGKKARPWRRPRGFCLRRATPSLHLRPHTGVAGVARTGPRPKAPPPAGARQGQKTPCKKNCKCLIKAFFLQEGEGKTRKTENTPDTFAVVVAQNAEEPTHSLGGCAPPPPRAPFLWIAKERGERKLAPGDVPRAFAGDALRPPYPCARTRASRESHAPAHAQKPSRPQAPARGKKRRAKRTASA